MTVSMTVSMRLRATASAAVMAVRLGCRRRVALSRRTPVLARQGHADQALDIAQISHFLPACDQ